MIRSDGNGTPCNIPIYLWRKSMKDPWRSRNYQVFFLSFLLFPISFDGRCPNSAAIGSILSFFQSFTNLNSLNFTFFCHIVFYSHIGHQLINFHSFFYSKSLTNFIWYFSCFFHSLVMFLKNFCLLWIDASWTLLNHLFEVIDTIKRNEMF